jgi:uncharacterized protein YegL/phosphoribosyl-AMP cyclohydrolase
MKIDFEKQYSFDIYSKVSEKIKSKIQKLESLHGKNFSEILKEKEKELAVLAQQVGLDFDMKVSFGKIGEGSYFRPDSKEIPAHLRNTIILDPLIILEHPGIDEFVTAHEGSHRAITRAYDYCFSEKTRQELDGVASKIGWGYVHNCLEDGAVNDHVGQRYSKIADFARENYDKSFEKENAVMSRSDVNQLMIDVGRNPDNPPRFVIFGSEIMRLWHTGDISKNLPPEIITAIEKTKRSQEAYYKSIPGQFPDERKVIKSAVLRWGLYEKTIWPVVQELIKVDMLDEILRQKFKKDIEDAIEKMKQDNQDGQQEGGKGGRSLDKVLDDYGFSEEEKKEIKEKIKEALEKQKKSKQDQGGEKSEKGEDQGSGNFNDEDGISSDNQDGVEEGGGGDSGQEQPDDDSNSSSGSGKDVKDNLPLDIDSMSESIKQKIKDAYEKSSQAEKDDLQKKAEDQLKKIEDELNKQIQAKTGKPEESHADRKNKQEQEKQRQKSESDTENLRKKLQEEKEKQYKELIERLMEGKNIYEKIFAQHKSLADELYRQIESFFQKKRHPQWQRFQSSGHLDLPMAMQFEADISLHDRMWKKKTIPTKTDYSFVVLGDLSSSMDPVKRENLMIANATIVEVLNTLEISNAVYGYTDNFGTGSVVQEFKSFEEKMKEQQRKKTTERLSGLMGAGGGNTPTLEAITEVSKILESRPKTKNNARFIIVITDGEPNGSLEDVKKRIEEIEKDTGQIVIGIGMGEGIDEEKLKAVFGDNYVYAKEPQELPTKISKVISYIFAKTQQVI